MPLRRRRIRDADTDATLPMRAMLSMSPARYVVLMPIWRRYATRVRR